MQGGSFRRHCENFHMLLGSFNDIPLCDVLSIIGNRVGVLTLNNLPSGREVQLHVSGGNLTAFYDNACPLRDGAWIRGALATLFRLEKGDFQFLAAPEGMPEIHVGLSIFPLLLDACGEAEQAHEFREYFPSPDTLFMIVNADAENLDSEMSGVLGTFRYLNGGVASPAEVATIVGVSLDQILWCFHKLRAAHLIRPVRPASAAPRTTRLVPEVAQKTLSASVDGFHPTPKITPSCPVPRATPVLPTPTLRKVRPASPPPGLTGLVRKFTSFIR